MGAGGHSRGRWLSCRLDVEALPLCLMSLASPQISLLCSLAPHMTWLLMHSRLTSAVSSAVSVTKSGLVGFCPVG